MILSLVTIFVDHGKRKRRDIWCSQFWKELNGNNIGVFTRPGFKGDLMTGEEPIEEVKPTSGNVFWALEASDQICR